MAKKQIPLRLSERLYNDIAAWAEADFRSVNGQIEYLLSECVKQRKKNGGYVGMEIDAPLDVDIEEFSDAQGAVSGPDPIEELKQLLAESIAEHPIPNSPDGDD